ncbi:YaaC family protein [Niallia sp. JL1B1071]|uniref:YaaC family protein n=1 Tax=Niallia tiangongensis TaxID=3237105 RepID=UPI0037DD9E1B
MSHYYKDWSSFSCFFSAEYSQKFLKKCYRDLYISDLETKSYQNCYPFMYFLEHGKLYYQQAEKAPLSIQPILLFYGLVHLIKACLLTVDPNYPNSTSVLAHGVSTRKLKKQQYLFFQDEVKIQKNGLFTFMAEKMFSCNNLEGEKVKMDFLFNQVPELSGLFQLLEGKSTFLQVKYLHPLISLPKHILDLYHSNSNHFKNQLESYYGIHLEEIEENRSELLIRLSEPLHQNNFIKWDTKEKSYVISSEKDRTCFSNEMLSHYLILYNLSMIARYEIEWWSELLKTMPNKDYPFIESFLLIAAEKGPQLIYQFLNKQVRT